MKNYTVKLTAGEELELWRRKQDLSIEKMAKRVAYSRGVYRMIESGLIEPDLLHRVNIERETNGAVPRYRWKEERKVDIMAHEYLVLLIRRRGMKMVEFCRKYYIHTTRLSGITHGNFYPCPAERERIAQAFKQLVGAWDGAVYEKRREA